MITPQQIQDTILLAQAYTLDLIEDIYVSQKRGCMDCKDASEVFRIDNLIYSLEGILQRNLIDDKTAKIYLCLQTAIANYSGVATIDPNAVVDGVTIIIEEGGGDNRPDPLLIEWSDLVSTGGDGRVRYDNPLWAGWVPFLEVDNSPWLTEGVDFINLTTGGFILTNPIYDGQVIRAVNYAKSGVVPPTPITPTVEFTQPSAMTVGDADQTLIATTTNPLGIIVYTSLNTAVATIVSGKLHAVSAGSVVVRASSPASTGYNEAHVDRTVVISGGSVTPNPPTNGIVDDENDTFTFTESV